MNDLYVSTNGYNWENFGVPWNFANNSDPCVNHWEGITCDSSNSNITILNLSGYGLLGTLPESIGNLTSLTQLLLGAANDTYFNFISGSIPETISNLIDLKVLFLDNNFFSGTIPNSFTNLISLEQLILSYNHNLTGVIPKNIGNLINLKVLEIEYCSLFGGIPQSIALLPLTTLALNNNSLTGPIPEDLFLNSNLQVLQLNDNQLNGSLPSQVSNQSQLLNLNVDNNLLTGKIPTTYNQFPELIVLYLSRNNLTGQIPFDLGNNKLKNLVRLELADNLLTGTFPGSICNLTSLLIISIELNSLYGTIPLCLPDLLRLIALDLHDNFFNGSIDVLTELSTLSILFLGFNDFIGSIPTSIGNLSYLIFFSLPNSYIDGTIPSELFNSGILLVLELQYNFLTGSIPSSIQNSISTLRSLSISYNELTNRPFELLSGMNSIEILQLDENRFSGSISKDICSWDKLYFLDVESNQFTGSIPSCIGNLMELSFIDLANNKLKGVIPSFPNLINLNFLLLNNNQFSGNLDKMFNATNQRGLQYVELSSNFITGNPFPSELLKLPNLQVFSLSTNCMKLESTIPPQICNLRSVVALGLDGLHSAIECESTVWYQSIIGNQILVIDKPVLKNGIPNCLFNLPLLQTLHLAGNGLTGSLQKNIQISLSLNELTLSHNLLTGTIPHTIQEHKSWINLDLSFNKLNGILFNNFTDCNENCTLSLKGNRLSGEIPPSLLISSKSGSIAILSGNMFTCNPFNENLPRDDYDEKIYSCGSTTFNNAIFVWVFVLALSFIIILVCERTNISKQIKFAFRKIKDYTNAFDDSTTVNLQQLNLLFRNIQYQFGIILIIGVIVLSSVYGYIGLYFSTYTYRYAWMISGLFLSGKTPGILLFIIFLLFLLYFPHSLHRNIIIIFEEEEIVQEEIVQEGAAVAEDEAEQSQNFWKDITVSILNVIVLILFDVFAFYVLFIVDRTTLIIIQFGIAIFQLLWDYFSTQLLRIKGKWIVLFVRLSSSIIAPFIAISLVSSNCFYNYLWKYDDITTEMTYTYCNVGNPLNRCVGYATDSVSSTFVAPFYYNYQCTSSILSIYSPLIMYKCMFNGLIFPMLPWFLLYLRQSFTDFTKFWSFPELRNQNFITRGKLHAIYDYLIGPLLLAPENPFFPPPRLIDKDWLTFNLINFTLLFSIYGILVPPVAVACAVGILLESISIKLAIGKAIFYFPAFRDFLDEQCAGVVKQFYQTLKVFMPVLALFYSFVCIDIVGDSGDSLLGVWFLIVFVVSVVIYFIKGKGISDVIVSRVNRAQPDFRTNAQQNRTLNTSLTVSLLQNVVASDPITLREEP